MAKERKNTNSNHEEESLQAAFEDEVQTRPEPDIQEDLELLKRDMAKLTSDVAEVADRLVSMGKYKTKSAADKVISDLREDLNRTKTATNRLLRELHEELDTAKERGKKSIETFEHTIQEKPLITLLIAFIVGMFLGKMWDRQE